MVSHRHIFVNGKKINIPSYKVKPGDVISVSPKFQPEEIKARLADAEVKAPSYFDRKAISGKLLSFPTREDVANPVDYQLVIEFYSR